MEFTPEGWTARVSEPKITVSFFLVFLMCCNNLVKQSQFSAMRKGMKYSIVISVVHTHTHLGGTYRAHFYLPHSLSEVDFPSPCEARSNDI